MLTTRSATSAIPTWPGLLIAGLVMVVIASLFSRMTVTVDAASVSLMMARGLVHHSWRLADLQAARVVHTNWYNGWGIHGWGHGLVGQLIVEPKGSTYHDPKTGAVIASYRKTHLWDREKLIFTPGGELPPILTTRHGVIAVMVCYDLEFGELTRRATLDGAELIAAPVNWPLFPRPEGERPGEVITAMSTARTNKVAIAACDRAGVERGQAWTEGTAIVDPHGWVAATAGPGSGLAIADIDLSITHDKTLTEHVHLLTDRRVDLY